MREKINPIPPIEIKPKKKKKGMKPTGCGTPAFNGCKFAATR